MRIQYLWRCGKHLKVRKPGGLKLEKAMSRFGLLLDGKVCMDVGASTGGFTDCMLQNGAEKVYCNRCGLWTIGLETAKRQEPCDLHGKHEYPLRDA